MSTYEALISVLGISEETADNFTVQTASDIANRSVELYQILEQLAKDGDIICQALEAQTQAQENINSGRNSVRLLKTILPHIRAYIAGRVGQSLVQDGEVSSTESVPASNGNTTPLLSPRLPNSDESSGERQLSLVGNHVPSTLEGPSGAVSNAVTSSSAEVYQCQSSQLMLGSERGTNSCTVNAIHDQFPQSVQAAAALGNRPMKVECSTVSQATTPAVLTVATTPAVQTVATTPAVQTVATTPAVQTVATTPAVQTVATIPAVQTVANTPAVQTVATIPAVQTVPTASVAIAPLQPSVSTCNVGVMSPATLAFDMHAVRSIMLRTCQSQPVAIPNAPHTFPSFNTSMCVASVNQADVVRAQAASLPHPHLQSQQLSHAGIPWHAPPGQPSAVIKAKQSFLSKLQWLSNSLPAHHLLSQSQSHLPGSNPTSSQLLQSEMKRLQYSHGANSLHLPAQEPQGGRHRQLPRVVVAQVQALPVMPSIMTPALYPSSRGERRTLNPPFDGAFSLLHAGQQQANPRHVRPQNELPLSSLQHHTAVVQHNYQATQSVAQHVVGARFPSQPLFKPLSGFIQRKTADLTSHPQSLTVYNHPHISVRHTLRGTSAQPLSYDPTHAIATAPLMSARVLSSPSAPELAHSNYSNVVAESQPFDIYTPVERPKVAVGSIEQRMEGCSSMSTCEEMQLSTLLPVEVPSKSKHAIKEVRSSAKAFGASINGPSKESGVGAASGCELVMVRDPLACPSSSEHQTTSTMSTEGGDKGVKSLSLDLQASVASPAEVQVLATGSVPSLTHAQPLKMHSTVPTSVPSSRELATLSSAPDTPAVPAPDPIVDDHAMEPAEISLQTPSTPVILSVDTTALDVNVPNFQSSVDPPTQSQGSNINTGPAIKPPVDLSIGLPKGPTFCSQRDQTSSSSMDPAIQQPTVATANPPMDTTILLQRDEATHFPVDSTIEPQTDRTVHPPTGAYSHQSDASTDSQVDTTIKPPSDANINPPMDTAIHHQCDNKSAVDTTIKPPADPFILTPVDETTLQRDASANCSMDPAIRPSDPAVHPPVNASIIQRDAITQSPLHPTIGLPSDSSVHSAVDPTTQRATAQSVRFVLDAAIQTEKGPLIHAPANAAILTQRDTDTHSPTDQTIVSLEDPSLQPPSNSDVDFQMDASTNLPTVPITYPPQVASFDLTAKATDHSQVVHDVYIPTKETTCVQPIKAKNNRRMVSDERLSFVTLMKKYALLHLTVLARMSKVNPARSAHQRPITSTRCASPDASSTGMGKEAELMETGNADCFPTYQDDAAFSFTPSEDSRMLDHLSLQSSKHKVVARPRTSQSIKGTKAVYGHSPKGKDKCRRLKDLHCPSPISRTPEKTLSQQDRVPPLRVGTAALIKFGVGEKADWREGIVTAIGNNGRKSRAPVCMVKTNDRPYGHRKELHQLAVVEPAKECDLRIKDVVVGWYGNLGTRFSGVAAETPVKENGHRVLVFFYDGFAQYLPPSRLHLCYQWDSITPDRNYRSIKKFFKEYFSQYPKRLMLRLREGDTVQLERFRDVLEARVVQVDCSLVKLQFAASEGSGVEQKYEWVYRGSTRLMPLCNEVIRRKGSHGGVPNTAFTFTDGLFDPECPPSTTPPDNTGVFPCFGQMPGKKPLPLGGVSSSEPRRKSSELHSRLSSSAFTAAREAPNVRELPTLSSSVHSDEETLPPFRRKRAASGEGLSRAKKARSLSTDGTPVTRAAMSSEEFDSDDSAFDNRSLSRCARKSKLQLAKTSLEDLKPHHAHHQGQTLPSEAASSSVSAQETEEDDMTFSRDCLVKSFAVPNFDHRCGPSCKGEASLPSNYVLHHSLAFPLMLKWKRCKQVYCKGSRQTQACHLYYIAPCGTRLKSLKEVEDQLCVMEENRITVDMFCFDIAISVNFRPVERPTTARFYNEDLSGGLETVPVTCINELDSEAPPPFEYRPHRRCGPGVELSHTKDFLLSCSCDSGCCAKEGCQCHKLSLEEAHRTRVHDLMHPLQAAEVGYTHRRLLTERTAAIFECNNGCRCSSYCGNRVVQSKMRPRLQVFKTKDRGWGVRCLDDLPKGTFVAHYSGIILTDKDADEAALVRTDAYLVDLDYIEVVESLKGGMEGDSVAGTSHSTTSTPSVSPASQAAANSLDRTWEGGSPVKEMEEHVGTAQQNEQARTTRRETRTANSEKPKAASLDNVPSIQPEHPPSSKSPNQVKLSPQMQTERALSPSSDDGDLPVFTLVNMTSRHPSASSTSSIQDSNKVPSSLTAFKDEVPVVKQEDCSLPFASVGEEILGRRRHVGTGARRSTGTSYEDPICLSDSESDDDSENLGSNASEPSSESSPSTEGSSSSATGVQQHPVPDSSPANDTWVSTQRQVFGEQQVFVIDASRVGNVARFFNHSCQPNLFVQNVFVDNHDIRLPWVALFAQTNIKAMTELTWDYNYVPGSVPNRELACKCGVPECRGRLL